MMTENKGFNELGFNTEGICTDRLWYWMVTILVLMSIGPAPKLDTLDDLKKGVSDFNDRVQGLEMDDLPGVFADED